MADTVQGKGIESNLIPFLPGAMRDIPTSNETAFRRHTFFISLKGILFGKMNYFWSLFKEPKGEKKKKKLFSTRLFHSTAVEERWLSCATSLLVCRSFTSRSALISPFRKERSRSNNTKKTATTLFSSLRLVPLSMAVITSGPKRDISQALLLLLPSPGRRQGAGQEKKAPPSGGPPFTGADGQHRWERRARERKKKRQLPLRNAPAAASNLLYEITRMI